MSGTVRVGVIGAGSWVVSAHLPRLRTHPEVELVSVCRKGPEMLGRIAETWGFPVATEDPAEAIAAGVDAVIVGSPAALHYEHAKLALEAGCHVLCEKPFTIDPAHARELVELAGRVGRELVLAFGWNFTPIVEAAKQLTTKPGIGTVEHLTLHMSSHTRELLMNEGVYPAAEDSVPPNRETWTDPSLSGGGYAQAQLTHALGLAMWLLDFEVTAATTRIVPARRPDVDLHLVSAVELSTGGVGAVSGGSCYSEASYGRHQLELRAIGSEGQLLIDAGTDELWLHRPESGDVRPAIPAGAGEYRFEGPIDTLVAAALGRSFSNNAPGWLGVRVTEALDKIYAGLAAHRTGALVAGT